MNALTLNTGRVSTTVIILIIKIPIFNKSYKKMTTIIFSPPLAFDQNYNLPKKPPKAKVNI